jgi:hypothetical protein
MATIVLPLRTLTPNAVPIGLVELATPCATCLTAIAIGFGLGVGVGDGVGVGLGPSWGTKTSWQELPV